MQYAVKNLASYLKTPTEAATTFAKQTVKYLLGTKDYGILYPYGSLVSNAMDRINNQESKETSKVPTVEVFTDSDWGGSAKDRNSTSSGMVFVRGSLVSSWSRTQKSIALSSCEAELVAATIGAAEGILIREVFKFVLNREVQLDIRMDSSSARQWLQRSGIGRLKHLAARSLWLQNAVKEKELFLKVIPTQFNLSDLNTKRLTRHRREMLMYYLPMVDSSSEPLEKVGEEEMYKAVCKRVCQGQGDNAVTIMTHLVQAVMLLEGIGVRGEGHMDRQVVPLRREAMEYFGYDDQLFVRDLCVAVLAVLLGTLIWLTWGKWSAGEEPEEEPVEHQQPGEPVEAQQQGEPAEAQQQGEPVEAQQQGEPVEAQQQGPVRPGNPEPAGEPDPRGQRQGQQQQQVPGVPEEVRERFNNWMREQLDDAHLQRVREEYQQRVQQDARLVCVTRTGVCFHSQNCPRLRHRRQNQLHVLPRGAAEARGYRQCDQCRG